MQKGSTGSRTRVVGIKIQSDNHYTIPPVCYLTRTNVQLISAKKEKKYTPEEHKHVHALLSFNSVTQCANVYHENRKLINICRESCFFAIMISISCVKNIKIMFSFIPHFPSFSEMDENNPLAYQFHSPDKSYEFTPENSETDTTRNEKVASWEIPRILRKKFKTPPAEEEWLDLVYAMRDNKVESITDLLKIYKKLDKTNQNYEYGKYGKIQDSEDKNGSKIQNKSNESKNSFKNDSNQKFKILESKYQKCKVLWNNGKKVIAEKTAENEHQKVVIEDFQRRHRDLVKKNNELEVRNSDLNLKLSDRLIDSDYERKEIRTNLNKHNFKEKSARSASPNAKLTKLAQFLSENTKPANETSNYPLSNKIEQLALKSGLNAQNTENENSRTENPEFFNYECKSPELQPSSPKLPLLSPEVLRPKILHSTPKPLEDPPTDSRRHRLPSPELIIIRNDRVQTTRTHARRVPEKKEPEKLVPEQNHRSPVYSVNSTSFMPTTPEYCNESQESPSQHERSTKRKRPEQEKHQPISSNGSKSPDYNRFSDFSESKRRNKKKPNPFAR